MKKYLLLCFIVVGCTTTARVSPYGTETYQPKPALSVEVFRTNKPTRPYIEIGEVAVRVKRSNEDKVVEMLREKAGELGADGLILIGEHSEGAFAQDIGETTVVKHLRSLFGVAIKYKD